MEGTTSKRKMKMVDIAIRVLTLTASFHPSSAFPVKSNEGYKKAALKFHQTVNISVDPCDDFYEHACGNFMANNPIPAHLSSYSDAHRIAEEVDKHMKALLESSERSSSSAIDKMKTIYQACVKEEGYVPKSPKVALDAIKEVGYWPMLEGDSKWNESSFSLQKLITNVKEKYSDTQFFQLKFMRDYKNVTRRIFHGWVQLNVEYYRNPEKYQKEFNATKKWIIGMITQFSRDVGLAVNKNLQKDVEEIFELETELAKIMKLEHERGDVKKEYNLRSFKEFKKEFKDIADLDFKEFALRTTDPVAHSVIIDYDTVIMIPDLEYPTKLAAVLKKANPKTITNYVLFRSVFNSFKLFLGQKYRDIDFEKNRELSGVKEQSPFWKRCNRIAYDMNHAYGALYARKYFDQDSKASMDRMIANLKEAFTEMVQEATWMDEETKSAAKKKVKGMIAIIGYDKDAFDDDKLDDYYAKLNISNSDNFIDMFFKFKQWSSKKQDENFMKPLDRSEFYGTASDVNAYNLGDKNAIGFPAGILQFPYFDKDQPEALNYGSIGSIIGHELTHGFDDQGKEFDETGNMKNWWNEEILKNFQEKAKCIVDQYSAVEVPNTDGMHINGKLTVGENIADNGGLRESYKAYQKLISKNGPEPTLPAIEATSEQLFFYGYSKFWCRNYRPAVLKDALLSSPHSPSKFRTNVVLQNSQEFSRAFSCPLGSPMNPKKKCSVW